MSDIDRLKELVGIMGNMPGDGDDLLRPYIDPNALGEYAHRCAHVAFGEYGSNLTNDQTIDMLATIFVSSFSMGCAWATMKSGSGEK